MADVEEREPLAAAAHEIASRHQLAGLKAQSDPLVSWTSLAATRAWLARARTAASRAPPQASSAAEWLLDNDYHVQRAILQIREDLPVRFYRKLPSASGENGAPRIHTLAHALLRASHLQISLNGAVQFIAQYQERMPLSIAEIWAFPTMLRIGCLELLVANFSSLFPDVEPPFEANARAGPVPGTDDTECVARAIANLAVISTIQWKDFFDRTSHVEAILRRDPAGVYPLMDFETRDRYRHVVEQLAQHSRLPEWDIAQRALAQCHSEGHAPSGHVGYWLVDAGRAAFEDAIDSRPFALEALGRRLLRYPGVLYATSLMLAGLVAFLVPALYLASVEATTGSWLLGVVLTVLPASVLSVTFVNWLVTLTVPPRILPKLDFEQGIAADCATAVVMPVLVARLSDVDPLLKRLESHHLSNPDPTLRFVLLSDHADAAEQVLATDDAIERALVCGINTLNSLHGDPNGNGPFHLMHRPRLYNAAQGCWMGWERKRGKLEQFNGFVLHGKLAPFSCTAGHIEMLRHTRFVVTADADTRLPPGVVNRLVGTLAHPLNTARFDPRTGRVARGYTILQPRVEIAPESTGRSLLARFYGGDTTIDIYSRAVSDVYQDLLGTGVFVGKGIYEVAPFERSVEDRIPENNLLSHDLFEGLHGRVALVSDVIVYEGFPSGYLDYAWRWHRWVRGDWQILLWLFPFVPGRDGRWLRNRLTWFDRLKIFDNLRRSLVPFSIVALLLGGWFLLHGDPLVWTLLALSAPAAYLFTDLVTGLAQGRRRGVMQSLLRRLSDHFGRWVLAVTFLVSDSAIALHAIGVTLWRLRSGQKLLEWTSAAHMSVRLASRNPRVSAWRDMAASPALAVLVAGGLFIKSPAVLAVAAPLLLLWTLAPEIAIRISRPISLPVEKLADSDRTFLRLIARRTWLFFETFVRPEDNWLPPDNYQEPPDEETAHRTSPTNIGMMLLSILTAWRLGHVGLNEAEMRLRNALDAIDRLEHYRGHILNWYDTRTLASLEPRYVSTVDSGNLAVSLIAVQQALGDARRMPPFGIERWAGFIDLLDLLTDTLGTTAAPLSSPEALVITGMRQTAMQASPDGADWLTRIDGLLNDDLPRLHEQIHVAASMAVERDSEALRELPSWLERAEHHLLSMRRDMRTFAPWAPLIAAPPPDCTDIAVRLEPLLAVGKPAPALADGAMQAKDLLSVFAEDLPPCPARSWAADLQIAIESGMTALKQLADRLDGDARHAGALAHDMDFTLLLDTSSHLFHIGYNVSSDRIDPHHYDLLASEARLASFFAIAKGDVAPEHWFHLGRPITKRAEGLALVSWNGSMFEYLMPNLFLRSDPATLLGKSDRTAVDVQSAFGKAHNIPWGISESSFASMGENRIYHYHAFGVPDLGLRRGLGRDLVVAPYATALALAARPAAAAHNLRYLATLGLVGRYGFYEAADFTPERVPPASRFAVVRSYMAHHHGMSLAALGNVLCDDMFVRWFHADPHIQTIDLLLNERIPWELPPEISRVEIAIPSVPEGAPPALHGWNAKRAGDFHGWHVIGNGRLSSRIRTDGAGGLGWQRHALTHVDLADHEAGYWLYLRDLDDGRLWSATGGPFPAEPEEPGPVFHAHQAEFHRRVHGISVSTTICVAHGDDLEFRRMVLVNDDDHSRTLDITSYAEVALAPPLEAARHPVFSKLFVGAEALAGSDGLLFSRRPRGPSESTPFLLHRVIGDDMGLVLRGMEADRCAFLGRHGRATGPAMLREGSLRGTLGWTLDPVFALQAQLTIPARGRREIAFITIAAGSRESALEVAERYTTLSALDWAASDAATAAAREIHALALSPSQIPETQALLSRLLQPSAGMRASPEDRSYGRSDLWALGISGDHPIVLLRASNGQSTVMLRFMLAAQRLWHRRGVIVDLVVTHEGSSGYLEPVRERILEVLREMGMQQRLGTNGGVHLLAIGPSDTQRAALLEGAATLALDEDGGGIDHQLIRSEAVPCQSPRFAPVDAEPIPRAPVPLTRPAGLAFDNGWGGFASDDGAYVIHLEPGATTPAPWSNVLANEDFGTVVTEAGLGFSWAVNSGENRLTPWFNDPVRDPQGERLYLRDEENARLWTPTPLPAGRDSVCHVRHGAGYSVWEQSSEGLAQELLAFVPVDDPVKLVRLRVRNLLPRARRITATYYAEWLLGAIQGEPAPFRSAGYDATVHAILANNPWAEFGERTAFLTSTLPPHSLTTSRRDFHGITDNPAQPEALLNWDLANRQHSVGADCCAAFQVHLDIPSEGTAEAVFVLGQGSNRSDAHRLIRRWQDAAAVERAWQQCLNAWDTRLHAVTVKTPDPAFDLVVNRWLPYQATNARLRARAGFYQASGAFGFRDQLQDVLALLHADPGAARRHILTAAAHQFEEGDVLHWWHPPSGRGVRTRCSDDLLWLPYAVASYVETTGDAAILAEEVPFLRGPALTEGESDRYARFEVTDYVQTLFAHCERALDRGYRLGAHGLPLIGAGDWNDGMDRVGQRGRGESVWLAWFLIAAIDGFAKLSARLDRHDLAEQWKRRAASLTIAVEREGWDGDWYVRAFDDDGRPWGTASESECRIDSIAQSWAVLSGAGDPGRARRAIASARRHLVRADDNLVRLLDPPFDRTPRDPGYIKAYPPGIRENGGQYSHAAAWLGMALARLGDGDGAKAVFDRINPVSHAGTHDGAVHYRIEPYVVAGDIAGAPPHQGRGGWSWYTGAAGWAWRLGVEEILGLRLINGKLRLSPCLPAAWHKVEATLTRPAGSLHVVIENPGGLGGGEYATVVDGQAWGKADIPFPDNGSTRSVKLRVGAPQGIQTTRKNDKS